MEGILIVAIWFSIMYGLFRWAETLGHRGQSYVMVGVLLSPVPSAVVLSAITVRKVFFKP